MDQRYAQRSLVNERIELWSGTEIYGEFEISNLSSSGIFVKNCQSKIGSFRDKPLTVKFCRNPNISYQASYDAVMVRETNYGVGLKWSHT